MAGDATDQEGRGGGGADGGSLGDRWTGRPKGLSRSRVLSGPALSVQVQTEEGLHSSGFASGSESTCPPGGSGPQGAPTQS